jgi:hypothetical protein
LIVIERPRVRRDDGRTVIEGPVSNSSATDRIWYAVDDAYGELAAMAGPEPFLLGILPVALEAGQDVRVRAPLSPRLYYSLVNYAVPLLRVLNPRYRPIRIVADELSARTPAGDAVATPFSGGIDSFVAVADHHWGTVPDAYRLSHLTYHNVGSHGRGAFGDRSFADRRRTIARFADEVGLPLVTIDSNLHQFMRHRFTETHTLRQLAAAHTLGALFGKFIFSTGVGYEDMRVRSGEPIGHADVAFTHLLSTEWMECIATGAQYSRAEKTERVAELEISRRFLDVCIELTEAPDGPPNCSRCRKCVRTMVTLDILGVLDQYGAVFDLDAWRSEGARRIGLVLGTGDNFSAEIRQLARQRGYRLPLISRVAAVGWRLAYAAPVRTRRTLKARLRPR